MKTLRKQVKGGFVNGAVEGPGWRLDVDTGDKAQKWQSRTVSLIKQFLEVRGKYSLNSQKPACHLIRSDTFR